MTGIIDSEHSGEYNTSIKDIAGLKDYSQIFNIINAYFNEPDTTGSMITDDNEFDIRTCILPDNAHWRHHSAWPVRIQVAERNIL